MKDTALLLICYIVVWVREKCQSPIYFLGHMEELALNLKEWGTGELSQLLTSCRTWESGCCTACGQQSRDDHDNRVWTSDGLEAGELAHCC